MSSDSVTGSADEAAETWLILNDLVRVVSRSFYESKYSILLDFLIYERMLPDDHLADRMQIMLKDVNKTAAKLREDRLIKCESRQEVRPRDQKAINRTYYYIDYKDFVDVTKFKIYKMRQMLESLLHDEVERKGYKCKQCQKLFSVLDVQSLLNPQSALFECDICGGEIEEHIDEVKLKRTEDALRRLNTQLDPIIQLLKKTDNIVIPKFSPAQYLNNRAIMEIASLSSSVEDLSRTSSPVPKSEAPVSEISVEIETADAASERSALPIWHTHSTITGQQVSKSIVGAKSQSVTEDLSSAPSQETDYLEKYQSSFYDSQPPNDGIEEPEPKRMREAEAPASDSIYVKVNGVPKQLDLLTDQDKALMTPEEYSDYYDIWMSTQ